MQIGQWLLAENAISESTLATALSLQKKWQARLGDVLLSMRAISPLVWLRALAAQEQPTYLLSVQPADYSLLIFQDFTHYIAQQFIPYKRSETTLFIATPTPTPALKSWCEAHYQCHIEMGVITARELHQCLAQRFSDEQTTHALEVLKETFPALSAQIPVMPAQKRGIIAFFLLILGCAMLAPINTWYVTLIITTQFYLATLAFKWLLLTQDTRNSDYEHTIKSLASGLNDATLPVYSILVPLYHETENVIRQLLEAIDALDYPKTKLDVLLITEQDDEATHAIICRLSPPDYCRILRIAPSHPRTKPKACNIALTHARGEFITIYDAEDIPDSAQLRLSVAAFMHGGEKLACVQAALNYYNRKENILTRLFSIEYSALFKQFLPALHNLRLPIPLGGTSNHIRTQILREVKAWDPYNVTEDADLGIRLHFLGYRTDILPSFTREESPISLKAWMKQRSRWIKGYIQTWLVYMRHPYQLYKTLGTPAFFGFQLFVGAPALTFLLAPFFWSISILLLFNLVPALTLPSWLLIACALTLILGLALHWFIAARVIAQEKWHDMYHAQLLYPFYWLLHSFACIKALWQLIFKPHFWEKTTHGASAYFAEKFSAK